MRDLTEIYPQTNLTFSTKEKQEKDMRTGALLNDEQVFFCFSLIC